MLLHLRIHQFIKGKELLFKNFEWQIEKNESWAIVGNIGTGKTTLLKLIAGTEYLPLHDGKLILENSLSTNEIEFVSFLDEKKWIVRKDFYYQQRYYTSFTDEEMKLKDFFELDTIDKIKYENIIQLTQKYKLDVLYDVPFIQLSNGQKNKSILIKSMQLDCKMLLLDNPFVGIDTESRIEIFKLIDEIISNNKFVIYSTNYPIFTTSTTHVLELKNQETYNLYLKENFPKKTNSNKKYANNRTTIKSKRKVIELNDVNISYHEKSILENINWTVFEAEKWAVLGENGSGKSTLLSLLYADHPHAYKNNILLFDEPRNNKSIWEIKSRIGYLSSEFHLHFIEPLNVFQTVATGFTDTLYFSKNLSAAQDNKIEECLKIFKIEKLKDRLFLNLSFGEQRLVLFVRAIIKKPELLILDEAYQGFDKATIELCNYYLNNILPASTTLIFTSHYKEEMPECINKYLYLEKGKIIMHD